MILFRALGADEDGLTIGETNGTITPNTLKDGTASLLHAKTAGGWNELFARMTDAIVGAVGHKFYFDFWNFTSRDCIAGLLNGTSPGVSNNISAYFTGTTNVRVIDGGTTPTANDSIPNNAWATLGLEILAAGQVEAFKLAQGDYAGTQTSLGVTTTPAAAFDPVGANLRFTSNPHTGNPTDFWFANLIYTDDGEVNPPPPATLAAGTPTETTCPVTWDDDDIDAVNADGVDIFADDGGGFVLVGTADVGDEEGTATGLTAETEYDLVARAYVTIGGDKFYSDDSNTETITTAATAGGGGGGGTGKPMNMAALISLLAV